MEIWKDIPGYIGFYQASNYGNIRSVSRPVKQHHDSVQIKTGKILRPATNRLGYRTCALSINNKLKSITVHRLVALTFLGYPLNDKNEINHKDGNKSNNCIENLEWCSRSYNINHCIKLGLLKYKSGEAHCNSKLTNKQRLEIVELKKIGMTLIEISKLYPVHFGTISKIIKSHDKTLNGATLRGMV